VTSTRCDVLLPVREARRTLPWAVRDILAQEHIDLRIIAVVDTASDGHDDGSADWLRSTARKERRIQVLEGTGQGAAAALDLALAETRAPLVSHMEADDRCPPDRLARLAAALHDGLDGVTSRAAQFGARTAGMRRYLDWQNSLLTGETMSRERFVEIPALHQTGLYRRTALESVGGYGVSGPWPVDIDFWLRWFEHERPIAKLPRVLYRWRQHSRQSTRSGAAHSLDNLRAAKIAGLARWLGPEGHQPTPLHLVSTGKTLETWGRDLTEAGILLAAQSTWRPGEPVPQRSSGSRFLAVYGTPAVRERYAGALTQDERMKLIFAA
jgi:glycosyltransferase involved in cell wall biosynthesis